MGLTTSLTNAVSGLRTNQDSMDVLSRNIANAGTPGYHKQSVTIVDYNNQTSTYARTVATTRAFNQSLQTYYTRQVSDTSDSDIQATYLNRLQTFLGKPGSAGSLDTVLGNLQNSMQSLATSPDDYSVRAGVVTNAQTMVETLNRLSSTVQGMRQEAEGQIASGVQSLNAMLASLQEVNQRVLNTTNSGGPSGEMLDQRDRLVSGIAELVDVRTTYRANGTVALATRSGVGLIDNGVATFSFDGGGTLSANSLFDTDSSKSSVGKLTLTTQSGATIDVVGQGLLQGGALGGLITLRDKTLVEAQDQLDEIAAGMAQAFSTNRVPGTAVEVSGANGFDVDLTNIQPGNDLLFTYSQGGVDKRVRVVNTAEPIDDYYDASGQLVIGVDLSGDLTLAAGVIDGKLPGLAISKSASGSGLLILDDGTNNSTDIKSAEARTTSAGLQGAGLGFNLFVDQGNAAFTNSLEGTSPQKRGFASRISVNAEIVADNRLLVQYQTGGTLGDAERASYVVAQLDSMTFATDDGSGARSSKFPLTGNLVELVSQVLNFQGSTINAAITKRDDRQLAMDTIVEQMDSQYGVNVDEEMARLMALQNAYAANARVVGVVKELLDTLFAAV